MGGTSSILFASLQVLVEKLSTLKPAPFVVSVSELWYTNPVSRNAKDVE